MTKILLSFILVFFTFNILPPKSGISKVKVRPQLCISFDDGNTNDVSFYKNEIWNQMILSHLKVKNVQAMFFVKGEGMDTKRGQEIISQWNNDGHWIGNHSYSHFNYSNSEINFKDYSQDMLKGESIVKQYSNFKKYYRFPYLKEGDTKEKRDSFRSFLKVHDYKIGHVTIDASDWYIDARLIKALNQNNQLDVVNFRKYYLNHIIDRANYYENLGKQITGRSIKHTLLLHHNLASALFMGDLIDALQLQGWDVINASDAYTDPIYNEIPTTIPAGESLLWALAKQTGKYEKILRFPAESHIYEKDLMDKNNL